MRTRQMGHKTNFVNEMMGNILCITGMHRSGTSFCASWLEGCGLKLFEKVEANVGNPLGHFEDKEILAIQSEELRRIDKKTKGWIIDKRMTPILSESSKTQVTKIIEARSKTGELWGWKDPRTTLFLRDWKRLIPRLKVILLWRDSSSVVDSLLRRSEKAGDVQGMIINKKQAITNWKLYNEKLLDYYLGHKNDTILVNINSVIQKDQSFLDLINKKFGFDLQRVSSSNYYRQSMINTKNDHKFKISTFEKWYYRLPTLEKELNKNSDIL